MINHSGATRRQSPPSNPSTSQPHEGERNSIACARPSEPALPPQPRLRVRPLGRLRQRRSNFPRRKTAEQVRVHHGVPIAAGVTIVRLLAVGWRGWVGGKGFCGEGGSNGWYHLCHRTSLKYLKKKNLMERSVNINRTFLITKNLNFCLLVVSET